MNGGKRRHNTARGSRGYTIIEVMIVLAVSGVMFLIASSFVSGKQGRTAFTEGVNELASTIQDTIEGVTNGQYTDIKVNCNFNGTTTSITAIGASGQGTNSKCVFLGKVLHFAEDDTHGDTPSQQYEVLSLAGGRVGLNNKPITDLVSAKPAVIPSLTAQATIPQRLNVTNVKVNNGAVISYGVALLQGLGTAETTGDVANGTQNVGLWYVEDLSDNKDTATATGIIAGGAKLKPAQRIDICISDGSRYATITLGANGNQLGVNVAMHGEANIC
ncbi:MAG TPA: prepilin-type N-terminal cleavage/methylation domain-containing protein [Candidatus Saccharimonadales bacterium]